MYFIYILQSEIDGTFYTGHTQDLKTRLKQHNSGRSTYTKRHMPYKIVYTEEFSTRFEAQVRERALKKRGNMKGFLKNKIPVELI